MDGLIIRKVEYVVEGYPGFVLYFYSGLARCSEGGTLRAAGCKLLRWVRKG